MEAGEFLSTLEELEKEIRDLQALKEQKERELHSLIARQNNHNLNNWEIRRFSRQILLPDVGVAGQEKLKKASVLIVGCGGLGCPVAQYLAGCGIGRIGLVDYDKIEETNLHRQLLYGEDSIGKMKVATAARILRNLNSRLKVDEYPVALSSSNARTIFDGYDVVVDCSDNPSTRYLVNDAAVMAGRPLVSGSAVGMEGQLSVYNYRGGPCYRCLFPQPPPPDTVASCDEAGVLGPVVGVMGVLQALQVIHLMLERGGATLAGTLLLFDGRDTRFRHIRLRNRSKTCLVCGDSPTLTRLIDYDQFCGASGLNKGETVNILRGEERISVSELRTAYKEKGNPVVIDVRPTTEFEICRLPGSVNIPLSSLDRPETQPLLQATILQSAPSPNEPVYVICRRGNDSQKAVAKLKDLFQENQDFFDVRGGLVAWSKEVDQTFPIY